MCGRLWGDYIEDDEAGNKVKLLQLDWCLVQLKVPIDKSEQRQIKVVLV